MNKLFAQILSLFLLLAVMARHVSPFFTDDQSLVTVANTEEEKGKEIEKQKEKDNTEKLFRTYTFHEIASGDQLIYTPAQIHFRYSAHLSLPEIPPDKI